MRRSHALVMPCATQGHINPLMQLSQHLVACHGFLITFVNTEYNHGRIMRARHKQSARCSPSYPEIKMVALSDGLPLDYHLRTVGFKALLQSIQLHMVPRIEQLICDINQTDNPITCIIADVFFHWIHDIAERLVIPCLIGFVPCSAAQFSLVYHIPWLLSTGQLNPDGTPRKSQEMITGVPGLRDIPGTNLIWHVGTPSDDEFMFNYIRSGARHAKKFKALLFNSFYELEKETIDALIQADLRVLPVGPLVLLDSYACFNVPNSDLWVQDDECLKWLDEKPKSSVLYIAFGSIAVSNTKELHELALGLEASGHSFLWVLRPDLLNVRASASLPEGFLERTKGRGLVTSWVRQALVLSHASIGAFLTHCGWNSTMEGIAMGVPMLAWPCFGDQTANSIYMIEEWKVGMSMLGNDGKVVDQQEVEKIVRSIMLSGVNEGVQMSKTVAILKEKARYAVEKDVGMSYNNLKDYIHQIITS